MPDITHFQSFLVQIKICSKPVCQCYKERESTRAEGIFHTWKFFLMYLANIICTNICMCGGYRKVRCYFSEAVHLGFFWERVFHWHGALPSLLGWLASKPQESAHLCLQVECWDYTIHYPTQLFKMGSTDWAQVLMFAKEALNWLSCFPRRYVQFWLTFTSF